MPLHTLLHAITPRGAPPQASREERAFRLWINSLGLEYEHVTDLASGMRDGILVLQILDTVQPGAVDWRKVSQCRSNGQPGSNGQPRSNGQCRFNGQPRSNGQPGRRSRDAPPHLSQVNKKPKNVYSRVANCNYAVSLGTSPAFGFSLVGIEGKDL